MKIYSNGRSEIIEQAWRKSFHMGFDLEIEPFWITMEADLSLPTKSNRKISMMTAFNEELYNSAADFISKVKLYDSDMREFSDDMLVTLVTKMLHNTIQKLNEKWEPLWNIFIKTPKAKARELELVKEEFLWVTKSTDKFSDADDNHQQEVQEPIYEQEEVIKPVIVKPLVKKKRVPKETLVITKQKTKPSTKIIEKPFSIKKEF